MIARPLLAASFVLLASACASRSSAPAAPQYQAPWANAAKPEFRYLLVAYGAANLPSRRDDTLDRYLRSQTKTFDRYVAAKEVRVGIEPLQQEAIAEIQAVAPELATKRFLVRTTFTAQAYDPQLGGFPLFQKPFDRNASVRYTNDDVRTAKVTEGEARGISAIVKDYGFNGAEVVFSKIGWFVPATPDQAVQMLEKLSQVGGERKVAVAMTYTLDRCDPAIDVADGLVCKATIRTLSGYRNLDAIQPDAPPVIELAHQGSR